jgi:hypothetical protein
MRIVGRALGQAPDSNRIGSPPSVLASAFIHIRMRRPVLAARAAADNNVRGKHS